MKLLRNQSYVVKSLAVMLSFLTVVTATPIHAASLPVSASFSIPSHLGTVKTVSRIAPDAPIVYLIEDAHANYDAQVKIKEILTHFSATRNLRTAFVEGASHALDPMHIQFAKDRAENKALLELLAREGEINGVELFLSEQSENFKAIGVENETLYTENVNQFTEIIKNYRQAETFLNKLEESLERLTQKDLSRDLRTFMHAWLSFKRTSDTVTTLLPQLVQSAKIYLDTDLNHPASQRSFPQLTRLTKMQKLESALDRAALSREWKKAGIDMAAHGAPEEFLAEAGEYVNVLLNDSLNNASAKQTSARETWEALYSSFLAYGFSFDAYPTLRAFVNYYVFRDELDAEGLHNEINSISDKLLLVMPKTEQETAAVALIRDAEMLRSAFSLELDEANAAAFDARFEELAPSRMAARLTDVILNPAKRDEESRDEILRFAQDDKMHETLALVRSFYRHAKLREEKMTARITEQMNAENIRESILIAGGFHTAGLAKRLGDMGISSVVITPRIESVDPDRRTYYRVMTGTDFREPKTNKNDSVAIRPISDGGIGALSSYRAAHIRRILAQEPVLTGFGADENANAVFSAEENAFLANFSRTNELSRIDTAYFTSLAAALRNKQAVAKPLNIRTDDHPQGNFKPSALLTPDERGDLLGAVDYTDLMGDKTRLAPLAKQVALTVHLMEGGLGSTVKRERYLQQNVPGREDGAIGAKGTDLQFDLVVPGKNARGETIDRRVSVSIAEAKLLNVLLAAKNNAYQRITYQPLVNTESLPSYVRLFDSIFLLDRLNDTIPSDQKRTYRQVAAESGLTIVSNDQLIIQRVLPTIDKATGLITDERKAPGGHGQLGVQLLVAALDAPAAEEGISDIRIFANGDNIASNPDPLIAARMAEERVAIVMVSTEATGIDKKGGKIGVQFDGDRPVRVQMMELAQAKKAGQQHLFETTGLPGGAGEAGKQFFNTNIAYLNYTVLAPILRDLRERLGEAEFFKVIGPDLIANEKEQNGKKFIQLEGAIGSALLNLSAFFESGDPRISDLLAKHNVKKFFRIVNVAETHRTQFFTPVKTAFDYWLQNYSDYYVFDTASWTLNDRSADQVPPLVSLGSPYYDDVQNLIDAFGRTSTRRLGELVIKVKKGAVLLPGSVLIGTVEIENTLEDNVNLTDEKYKVSLGSLYMNGQLVLENVRIAITEQGILIDKISAAGFGRAFFEPTAPDALPAPKRNALCVRFAKDGTQSVFTHADEAITETVQRELLEPFVITESVGAVGEKLTRIETMMASLEAAVFSSASTGDTGVPLLLSAKAITSSDVADALIGSLSREDNLYLLKGDTQAGRASAVERIADRTNVTTLPGLTLNAFTLTEKIRSRFGEQTTVGGVLGSQISIEGNVSAADHFILQLLNDDALMLEGADRETRERLTARIHLSLVRLARLLAVTGTTLRHQITDELGLVNLGPSGIWQVESYAAADRILARLEESLAAQNLILQAA